MLLDEGNSRFGAETRKRTNALRFRHWNIKRRHFNRSIPVLPSTSSETTQKKAAATIRSGLAITHLNNARSFHILSGILIGYTTITCDLVANRRNKEVIVPIEWKDGDTRKFEQQLEETTRGNSTKGWKTHESRRYVDSHPKCNSYNCNHPGACILGTKDNLAGYTTRYYRKERKVRRTGKGAKRRKTQGRVFAIGTEEAHQDPIQVLINMQQVENDSRSHMSLILGELITHTKTPRNTHT
ncbi:hypothetical protein OSB04_015491 [Centaurea solstitialis]|uniref:Uncharacterized protein n=1 Tax=Centaurea solstitialis TaxID=347529 RepID=A0AA38TCI7_9ASTR|nr:hypothetical protein OSB04_015491 [Centaurea solstitialis]